MGTRQKDDDDKKTTTRRQRQEDNDDEVDDGEVFILLSMGAKRDSLLGVVMVVCWLYKVLVSLQLRVLGLSGYRREDGLSTATGHLRPRRTAKSRAQWQSQADLGRRRLTENQQGQRRHMDWQRHRVVLHPWFCSPYASRESRDRDV